MKIIGLTGSIGMGKSVAAAMIRQLGIAVHDSDAAVHAALDGDAFAEVAEKFPALVDQNNRRIDRALLGKIIFADKDKRLMLESILHPHVWASQKKFIDAAKQRGDTAVVLDIPLLYETGAEKKCDLVICVTAPYFLQRLRVLRRPGMTLEKFQAILKQQLPDAEKRRRADIVIHTGMGRAYTLRALKKALNVSV